jgi:ubiquinone/menaquinone biosynthesis C-methylase UbiE
MSERSFDDFDAYANDYRSIHTDNVRLSGADSFYFAEMKVRLLKAVEKDEPLQLLDIGCGDGATELFMQRYFPQWKLTGIDVSAKSIEAAQQKQLPQVSFCVYDGLHIPFEANSMDIVFIAGVLHHMDATFHLEILTEAARVLKKGGRLYIYEHNPLNPLTKYLVRTCVFDKDARLLRSGYLARLLKRSGFIIDKLQFIIFFPRKGLLAKGIFLEKWLRWLPLGGQYFFKATKN